MEILITDLLLFTYLVASMLVEIFLVLQTRLLHQQHQSWFNFDQNEDHPIFFYQSSVFLVSCTVIFFDTKKSEIINHTNSSAKKNLFFSFKPLDFSAWNQLFYC